MVPEAATHTISIPEKPKPTKNTDINVAYIDLKKVKEIRDMRKKTDKISSIIESCFKSAGLGNDYRYEGQFIIGSALFFNDTVIHMAFFKNDDPVVAKNQSDNMQSYRNRMRNRSI